MRPRHPALAEAYAPDPDRAGPNAPAHLPEWLVHLLALIIRFMLQRALAARGRRTPLPSWWHARPDLPPASTLALAASVRGAFGNAIAWMCLRRGIGPGHQDWPELSRTIVAFGGNLRRFRAGMPAWGVQWWENPDITPGMIGMPAPTPAADAMARLLSLPAVVVLPPPAPLVAPTEAAPAAPPALRRPVLARIGTGPPTGPPVRGLPIFVTPDARGRTMASPAILIRAAAMRSGRPLVSPPC